MNAWRRGAPRSRIVAIILVSAMVASSTAGQDAPDARAALRELVEVVRERHAYASLRGLDLDALAADALERLGDEPGRDEIIIEMHRLVCRLGDGHASVRGFYDALPSGYLPVLLAGAEGGVSAVHPDRSALYDPRRPYVRSIDGVPIQQWRDAVAPYVTDGSRQLVGVRTLFMLRWIRFARRLLGLDDPPGVTLTLTAKGGGDPRGVSLLLADEPAPFTTWPRVANPSLDADLGYLRLPTMSLDDDELASIRTRLRALAADPDLRGLIVDVRGNGGGNRDAMRLVAGALADAPYVYNAARRRRVRDAHPGDAGVESQLANRGLYPLGWAGWTPPERKVVEAFAAGFRPRWSPPEDDFGPWHYGVIRPRPTLRIDVPVVVLIDGGCFSATDVFAAALAELAPVTLVGTPTSGGSARSQRHRLETIGTSVRLATMASYMPDGRLFDGNGVAPDVLVEPGSEFLATGGADAQLTRALELLRAGR